MALEESHKLVYAVGVDTVGGDVRLAYSFCQGIAFGLCARGKHNLGEHFRMLGAFVSHDCAHTSDADNNDF